MSTSVVILALAVFGASAVEAVEALTIVLAAGVTRGWRSAFEGMALALVVLAVLVAGVGVPLVHYVPIDVLRVVIGALLLVLGLNWLRKAVLRASGHKALHDEDAIYKRTVSELSAGGATTGGATTGAATTGAATTGAATTGAATTGAATTGAATTGAATTGGRKGWRNDERDATGFVVAFKGVFLEGLEVVLIVLTLGASGGHLGLAAAAAAVAVLVVAIIGAVVARQLSEVPENAMKMGVGIMLTSFGVFWVGEGSGLRWPGSDLFLLALVAIFVASSAVATIAMRRALPQQKAVVRQPTEVVAP